MIISRGCAYRPLGLRNTNAMSCADRPYRGSSSWGQWRRLQVSTSTVATLLPTLVGADGGVGPRILKGLDHVMKGTRSWSLRFIAKSYARICKASHAEGMPTLWPV